MFNYCLSRVRCVGIAFDILSQRWRILRAPLAASEENIRRIIAACITLHNFLMKEFEASSANYTPHVPIERKDWDGKTVDAQWRVEDNQNGFSALPRNAITGNRYVIIAVTGRANRRESK